jgi:hypothetical protein
LNRVPPKSPVRCCQVIVTISERSHGRRCPSRRAPVPTRPRRRGGLQRLHGRRGLDPGPPTKERHRLGIFTAIGLLAATWAPAGEYLSYAYWTRSGSLPDPILVAWALLGGTWYLTMALALVFTPLLFPAGAWLAGPRRRPTWCWPPSSRIWTGLRVATSPTRSGWPGWETETLRRARSGWERQATSARYRLWSMSPERGMAVAYPGLRDGPAFGWAGPSELFGARWALPPRRGRRPSTGSRRGR